MSDCESAEIRDLLPDYVHGTLSAEALRRVEAHIAECGLCSEEWALLRRLGGALSAMPPVNVAAIVAALPPSPAMRPRLVSSESAPVRSIRRAPFAQPWLRVAAGIVLLAGAGSLVIARSNRHAGATELSTGVASGLTDAELRGLLDEIDHLQAMPAETSEDIVRGLPGVSGDL